MSALLKSVREFSVLSCDALHTGDGIEMFSSGSAPMASDGLTGDAVEMFSSGSAPRTTVATAGDATGLFSSGS